MPTTQPSCSFLRSGAFLAVLLGSFLATQAAPAQAQMFREPVLQTLYAGDRWSELQQAGGARVAARADDAEAVLAVALGALQVEGAGGAAARQRAIAASEACIAVRATAVPCQYALGVVLGTQALSEGMVAAARNAGRIRGALAAALEGDPAWHPARAALLEFYLMAPGLMGGSSAKAAELARGATTAEQARALQARIHLGDRKFDAALALLAALPPSLEPALREDVEQWGTQAALGLVNNGKAEQAAPFFERLMREAPTRASGPYGLARVRAETGAHEQALRLYDQAAAQRGAEAWPVDWRKAISLMALARNEEARELLRRFVAAGRGSKASLDDARKRLAQLGGAG